MEICDVLVTVVVMLASAPYCEPGRGTLGISGWGCAARTLEPLAYSLDKIFNQLISFLKNYSLF